MNPWFIVAFVVLDVVVMAVVLSVGFFRRGGKLASGLDLPTIFRLTRDMEQPIVDYLHANWSGDPATLSLALTPLLGDMEKMAAERGVAVDRRTLKLLLARTVESKHLANGRDVREAMRQIA